MMDIFDFLLLLFYFDFLNGRGEEEKKLKDILQSNCPVLFKNVVVVWSLSFLTLYDPMDHSSSVLHKR